MSCIVRNITRTFLTCLASLAKEYIEISDLDENSAKVRFTDSEDEEESSEGVNDRGTVHFSFGVYYL